MTIITDMFNSVLIEQSYGFRWMTREEGLTVPDPVTGHSPSGFVNSLDDLERIYKVFRRAWNYNDFIVMGIVGQSDKKAWFLNSRNTRITQALQNQNDGLYYVNDRVYFV